MLTKSGVVTLLSIHRKLILSHLEMSNENLSLVQVVNRLREVLFHFENDLREYISYADEKLRESIGDVQEEIDQEKLSKLREQLEYLLHHLHRHVNHLMHRLTTALSYQDVLEEQLRKWELEKDLIALLQNQSELARFSEQQTKLYRRNLELQHQEHDTIKEIQDLKDNLNHFAKQIKYLNSLQFSNVIKANTIQETNQELERHRVQFVVGYKYVQDLNQQLKQQLEKTFNLREQLQQEEQRHFNPQLKQDLTKIFNRGDS